MEKVLSVFTYLPIGKGFSLKLKDTESTGCVINQSITVIEIRLLLLKIFNGVWNKRIIKSVCINSNVFECLTFSQSASDVLVSLRW